MEKKVTWVAIVRLVAKMKEYVQNAIQDSISAVTEELSKLISGKADKSTTYTKTEVDAKVDEKINFTYVYDKTTIDQMFRSKLSTKVESSDVYKKDEVYTKEYIDETYASAEDTETAIADVVNMLNTKTSANKGLIDSVSSKSVVLTGTYTGTEEISIASLVQPVYKDTTKTIKLYKGDTLNTVLGYDDDIMLLNTANELVARVTQNTPYVHNSVNPITVYLAIDEVSGHTNAYSITKKITITDLYKKVAELLTIN